MQNEKSGDLLWYVEFNSTQDLENNLNFVRLVWPTLFGVFLFLIALTFGVLLPTGIFESFQIALSCSALAFFYLQFRARNRKSKKNERDKNYNWAKLGWAVAFGVLACSISLLCGVVLPAGLLPSLAIGFIGFATLYGYMLLCSKDHFRVKQPVLE